jgi:uncharacterized protein YecT (DUF1311 family)
VSQVTSGSAMSGRKLLRSRRGAPVLTIAETNALIEAQRAKIEKKTAELNDGTGLTSRDMVNLQDEIAGHEQRVGELEESELEEMETARSRRGGTRRHR